MSMKTEENPLVSVITPTYKRSTELIASVIDMVKAQTYAPIEHVIIDDNPPDSKDRLRVEAFMKAYEGDPGILYIQNERNLGGAMARNAGIFASRGAYITLLDDDDGYAPEKIEKQVRFMQEEDCDLSFTNVRMVNMSGVTVDVRDHSFLKRFDNEYLLKCHITRNLSGTSGFMFRAEALKRIGGFNDTKMSHEYMLMLKSIEQGLKIRHLDRCDAWGYRDSGEALVQISQGQNKIRGEMRLYELKKTYYPILSLRERMFVRFRHHAVIAVTYKRNRAYGKMLFSLMLMGLSSPLDCVKEGFKFLVNVFRQQKNEREGKNDNA